MRPVVAARRTTSSRADRRLGFCHRSIVAAFGPIDMGFAVWSTEG